ncbi:MAG: EpsI domain-containing exosortase [Marinobacter sp.]|nr:EpsI domain-containing exosortase [Marinobacter sp.]
MEGNRSGSLFALAAPFLIVYGPLLVTLSPTLVGISSRWLKFDESYSHGFLLLAVSAYLVVRTARSLRPTPGFYPFWLIPFTLALLAYGLGGLLRVEALQHLMIVPLVLGALAVLLGWQQVKHFIAPIGLVFFAMPVWDFLAWTLQLITVEINRLLLGMFNIEFEVEGVFVYLIGVGAFEVAHGCSGLRYLLVGQSLALMYGELNLRTVRAKVILFLSGVFLALLANWIRVFVIIYMGYETNMQTSLIEDHDSFGWWVFAATLVPLFLLGRRLEGLPAEQAPVELNNEVSSTACSSRKLITGALLTAVLPLIAWWALPASGGSASEEAAKLEVRLEPENYGPLFSNGLAGWRPRVINPDRVFTQTVFDRAGIDEGTVADESLFLGVYSYDYQRESAEVVQYSNRVFDPSQWHTESFFSVTGLNGVPLTGMELRHRVTDERIYLAYGYYVEGFWETDDLRAKLAQVRGFFNSRSDASLMVFGVACDNCDGRGRLQGWINSAMDSAVAAVDKNATDN